MKVVMIAPFAFKPKGTTRARIFPIGRELAKRGHQVAILIPPYDNPVDSEKEYVKEGVLIRNARLKVDSIASRIIVPALLAKDTMKLKPEVVHIFKPIGYSGLAGMYLRIFSRLPLVVDSDDWEGKGGWGEVNPYTPLLKRFFDFQENWLPTHARAVTVASRTLETRMWGLGIPQKKVFYIPNCPGWPLDGSENIADKERLKIRRELGVGDAPLLIYFGHIPLGNDLDILIDALKIVGRRIPNVKCVVVGVGEGLADLKKMAEESGQGERFLFTGWVDHTLMPYYLAAADVAVYPYRDTLINRAKCSVKIVEYMAMGKAVITSKVGQNLEYIENWRSGILTEPGSVEGFAEGIISVLSNRELREEIGKNAARRVREEFTWDKWVKVLEEAYREACGEGSR